MLIDGGEKVAVLTVRDIDDDLKARLRVRAAQHGRSMEAEVREILRAALEFGEAEPEVGLAESIRRRFAKYGGVNLEIPDRSEYPVRDPDLFS